MLPGNQLPAFMQTRKPLLLKGRGCDGRTATLLTKEEVNIVAFMAATVPRGCLRSLPSRALAAIETRKSHSG